MSIYNKENIKKICVAGFMPITNFPAFTHYSASSSLTPFINTLYTYAIGIAAILAVIEIIWGGFLWMGSGASVSSKEAGRQKILMSILGLVLVLSPYLILSIINPNMLSLRLGVNTMNVNTKKIGTQTFATQQATSNSKTTESTNKCSISGTLLKTATCPSNASAQSWASKSCNGSSEISCSTVNPAGVCVKTTAICSSVSKKPFMFLDKSYYLNPIITFSNYQPLVSIPKNPKNGSDAVNFINSCTADKGLTCLTQKDFLSTSCSSYYTTNQPSSQSNKCYYSKLSCTENAISDKNTKCSSNPSYTPIK